MSDIAVEFAESIGIVLDPWQRWLVRWTFVRRPDRLWAARDVGVEVTRQSGKNIWLEVVELAGLFLFGDRLIIHSAHRADVSHEHFLSVKAHIEACDDLMDAMPTSKTNNGFITTNGNESVQLRNGARLLFKARAKASGRGNRPQKIIFDEALVLDESQVGSMVPSISAQPNPQVIFASSSPKVSSEVLHDLRRRAVETDAADRFFFAAWNNPPDVDITDRDAWYRVNPSLGFGRMTETSLMANRNLMGEREFLREHLGVPDTSERDVRPVKLPADRWAAAAVDIDYVGPCTVAYEVTLDGSWSSVVLAAGDQGAPYVQQLAHRQGTGWLPDELVRIVQSLQPTRLACIGAGPAGAQVGPVMLALSEAGIRLPLEQLPVVAYRQACGAFYLDVVEGRLSWFAGSEPLDAAARDAAERRYGDSWLWDIRNVTVPISPLVAATVARALLPTATASRTVYGADRGLVSL